MVDTQRISAAVLDRRLTELGSRAPGVDPIDVERVLAAVDFVARSWRDHTTEERRALDLALVHDTGYTLPVVRTALDDLLAEIDAAHLRDLITFDAPWLPERRPRLVLHINAGTVFPPAIIGPITSLLIGATCVVKPAGSTPTLAEAFARALRTADPIVGARCIVARWRRDDTPHTRAALRAADTVVAHGDDATIAAIQALAPSDTLVVPHGHRTSACVVSAAALRNDPDVAKGIARDVAIYDQEGCLSPHMVLVIDNTQGAEVEAAGQLDRALTAVGRSLPRGPLTTVQSSALRQVVETLELETYARGGTVLGSIERGHVVLADASTETDFRWSPGKRTLAVRRVPSVDRALDVLTRISPALQAVGLALEEHRAAQFDRVLNREAHASSSPGRVRLCAPGEMQRPPITWCADGIRPLAGQCRSRVRT